MSSVKGFRATLQGAAALLDAVYDVTLSFPNGPPTIFQFVRSCRPNKRNDHESTYWPA